METCEVIPPFIYKTFRFRNKIDQNSIKVVFASKYDKINYNDIREVIVWLKYTLTNYINCEVAVSSRASRSILF